MRRGRSRSRSPRRGGNAADAELFDAGFDAEEEQVDPAVADAAGLKKSERPIVRSETLELEDAVGGESERLATNTKQIYRKKELTATLKE